jgi:hypothetical protein
MHLTRFSKIPGAMPCYLARVFIHPSLVAYYSHHQHSVLLLLLLLPLLCLLLCLLPCLTALRL